MTGRREVLVNLKREEREMAEGIRKGKLGGRDRCREGISGVVLGLKRLCLADGYRWSPLHCGTGCRTGSGRDVRLQLAVNLETEDEDAAEWIKGSSWCYHSNAVLFRGTLSGSFHPYASKTKTINLLILV